MKLRGMTTNINIGVLAKANTRNASGKSFDRPGPLSWDSKATKKKTPTGTPTYSISPDEKKVDKLAMMKELLEGLM